MARFDREAFGNDRGADSKTDRRRDLVKRGAGEPRAKQPREPQSKAKPVAAIAPLFEAPKMEGPIMPHSERQSALDAIRAEVAACTKCAELCASRTQTVPGEGNPSTRLMFIGEAPGAEEDRTGRPFVGRSGMLLTDMITKGMGLSREDVFIGNVVKCRPADNRDPTPQEAANCLPYLKRQIEIIRPEFLCLLGRTAVRYLLDTVMPLSRMRGKWHRYLDVPTVVTWHPAYLLRNPAAKKDTWDDLQMLMKAMGLKPPERKKNE